LGVDFGFSLSSDFLLKIKSLFLTFAFPFDLLPRMPQLNLDQLIPYLELELGFFSGASLDFVLSSGFLLKMGK
jgi:hypothetical protein